MISLIASILTIILALLPIAVRVPTLRKKFLDQIIEIDPLLLLRDVDKEKVEQDYISTKSGIMSVDRVDRFMFNITVFATQKYLLFVSLILLGLLQVFLFTWALRMSLPEIFFGFEGPNLSVYLAFILLIPYIFSSIRMVADLELVMLGFEVSLGDNGVFYHSAYNHMLSIEKFYDAGSFASKGIPASDSLRVISFETKSKIPIFSRTHVALSDGKNVWRVFEFPKWMSWVSNAPEAVSAMKTMNPFIRSRYSASKQ